MATLRAAREGRRLSLRDLSVVTGIDYSVLAKLERHELTMTGDYALRLIRALAVGPDDVSEIAELRKAAPA